MAGMKGLDDLQRKLTDIARRTKNLSGTQNVPIPELLTPDFLSRCSRFLSADEMLAASGFQIDTVEDFTSIPGSEWDSFIRSNTSFASWEAMLGEAGGEWAARRLGF